MLAFAGTGLAAFSTFAFASRIRGEMWEMNLTFLLGGVFILCGTFSSYIVDHRPMSRAWIYALSMTALGVTSAIVSPIWGFFLIILLPLASQIIFLFPWHISLPWGICCYLFSCLLYYPPYGSDGFIQALIRYSPAYVFTMVFSYVTRDALLAREEAMRLKEELENANAQLRAQATQAGELAITRERNRLAREIHDGVGHYLTVINVQLEAAATLLANDDADRAAGSLHKAAGLSRDALDDVRRSVGSLHTDVKRPPLDEAIRDLTTDAGVPVKFTVAGKPRPLSEAANHALFRAAQEGLTNIRKHATASQSWITLDFADPARTRLTVEDDGIGPTADATTDGFGLRGMHERIELLGGRVESGPRTTGGFMLNVEVPA